MNRELAMKVANAVLYEGYMLYPYRPSAIKNRQRWSFGILYPPAYEEVRCGTERSHMHSECLLKVARDPVVHIQLRFLHLVARQVLQAAGDHLEPVASLIVDGELVESWEEGEERTLEFETSASTGSSKTFSFRCDGGNAKGPLQGASGHVVGERNRTQHELQGTVTFRSQPVRSKVAKLIVDVANTSSAIAGVTDRDSALLSALLSAHTILTVTGGEFISLLDPPDDVRHEVAGCHNIGNFPVLVGSEGERDMLLCSPIVLYDYPQIAPESTGDLYDSTEMDEMLTLRVMTLTDEEKREMQTGDGRIRHLLERTENSAREQLMRTHGTIRSMRPVSEK